MSEILIKAEARSDIGKGASRRLRHQDLIPGVIYGGDKKPESITFIHKDIMKSMENEEFYSQILDLELNGTKEQVVLKDVQRHPFKRRVMHLDFMRINAKEKLTMHIPLHFIGEDVAPGVKLGGIISHSISEVEIRCLPKDLPKFIEVDISNLELNAAIHLSELNIGKNIELLSLTHGDQPVVAIHTAKTAAEPTADEAEQSPEVATVKEEQAEAAKE